MSYELLQTIVIVETLSIILIIIQTWTNHKNEVKKNDVQFTYNIELLGKALDLSKEKKYEESIQIYEKLLSYGYNNHTLRSSILANMCSCPAKAGGFPHPTTWK